MNSSQYQPQGFFPWLLQQIFKPKIVGPRTVGVLVRRLPEEDPKHFSEGIPAGDARILAALDGVEGVLSRERGLVEFIRGSSPFAIGFYPRGEAADVYVAGVAGYARIPIANAHVASRFDRRFGYMVETLKSSLRNQGLRNASIGARKHIDATAKAAPAPAPPAAAPPSSAAPPAPAAQPAEPAEKIKKSTLPLGTNMDGLAGDELGDNASLERDLGELLDKELQAAGDGSEEEASGDFDPLAASGAIDLGHVDGATLALSMDELLGEMAEQDEVDEAAPTRLWDVPLDELAAAGGGAAGAAELEEALRAAGVTVPGGDEEEAAAISAPDPTLADADGVMRINGDILTSANQTLICKRFGLDPKQGQHLMMQLVTNHGQILGGERTLMDIPGQGGKTRLAITKEGDSHIIEQLET